MKDLIPNKDTKGQSMKKEKCYQDTHKINIRIIFQSPILRRCLEIIKEVTALQIQRSTDVISAWTISTRYISKDNTRNSYVRFNTFQRSICSIKIFKRHYTITPYSTEIRNLTNGIKLQYQQISNCSFEQHNKL